MKFSVYQISCQGGRDDNEDRLGYSYTREAVLLTLADGMGGYQDGELAAEIAVRVFTQRFLTLARPRLAQPLDFLQHSLLAANQAIVDHARAHSLPEQPRTTLVAAVIQDGCFWSVHAGDSRLYWMRQARVLQRTRDHSYQDKPELFRHLAPPANRNLLFTCLGNAGLPLYDSQGPCALQPEDRLLLCSDGLWSVVEDEELAAALQVMGLRNAVHTLAELALERAGRQSDNVSLLGLQWQASDARSGPAAAQPDALDDEDWYSTVVPEGSTASADAAQSAAADVFDLERIERSIEEIQAAIGRSARRKPGP